MRNAFVRNSKNLIDADILVGFGAEKVGENEYYFEYASVSRGKHIWDNTEHYQGQVTISCDVEYVNNSTSLVGVIFEFHYTDGTISSLVRFPTVNAGYQKYVDVSTANKVVDYIACSYQTGSAKSYFTNIMLNKGTKALPYAPPHKISQVKALAVARNPANLFDVSKIPTKGTVTNNGDGTLTLSIYSNTTSVKLRDCCPDLQSGKEYWLNIKSPAAFARQIYLYGVNIAWAFDTKKTITDAMLDSILILYGYHNSESQFGQPCVISEIIISETTAEPYFKIRKFKIDCKEV